MAVSYGGRYRKGANFENEVVDLFQAAGFSAARVAGSHGIYDVVACRLPWVFLVQCKTGGVFSTKDWNTLVTHCHAHGAVPVLASKKTHSGEIVLEQLQGLAQGRVRSKTILDLEEITIGRNIHEDSRGDIRDETGCAEVPEESLGYTPYPADQIRAGD